MARKRHHLPRVEGPVIRPGKERTRIISHIGAPEVTEGQSEPAYRGHKTAFNPMGYSRDKHGNPI
jgi:hypothetical protein